MADLGLTVEEPGGFCSMLDIADGARLRLHANCTVLGSYREQEYRFLRGIDMLLWDVCRQALSLVAVAGARSRQICVCFMLLSVSAVTAHAATVGTMPGEFSVDLTGSAT